MVFHGIQCWPRCSLRRVLKVWLRHCIAIASLAMLSKSQRNKQNALVTTDDESDVDILEEWAMSWRQKRSAIGDPTGKSAIGDSTVGTLRPVVEIKTVSHMDKARPRKKEGLLVCASKQWHLYFYVSPDFTEDTMFRRIAEHPMTALGRNEPVKEVWHAINGPKTVHLEDWSYGYSFLSRRNFSVRAGYSKNCDGKPDQVGRQMSHAWMTLSSGRWRSEDGGQHNLELIANMLCEIAGFEFPYPHVFEDVKLLPALWKKGRTGDACGSAARSSNNVPGSDEPMYVTMPVMRPMPEPEKVDRILRTVFQDSGNPYETMQDDEKFPPHEMAWHCNHTQWKDDGNLNGLRDALHDMKTFCALLDESPDMRFLRQLPWRQIVAHVFRNVTSASRILDPNGFNAYLDKWCKESVRAREVLSWARCSREDLCLQCRPGAWLGDCLYTESLVEIGELSANAKFTVILNKDYKRFAIDIGMDKSTTEASENNCGNQIEFLFWLALEERRYEWAVSVAEFMARKLKS
jgi:hypothetical protein